MQLSSDYPDVFAKMPKYCCLVEIFLFFRCNDDKLNFKSK